LLGKVQNPVDDGLRLSRAGGRNQPDGLVWRLNQGELVIVGVRLEGLERRSGIQFHSGQTLLKLLLKLFANVEIRELVI
jgi:hypothetical protein